MYFTNGVTRSFENMMTAVPNFGIRGKGRVILNQFHYTPQTVDCALCTEHHQRKCGLDRCPYLKEKIEAGEVSCKSLVDDCFADTKNIAFDRRLPTVYTPGHLLFVLRANSPCDRRLPSLYTDPQHNKRFALAKSYKDDAQAFFTKPPANTPPHIFAALFLLTSSFHLWSRCELAASKYGISFEKVNLRGIAMNDYIVFQAAKTIYTGVESITLTDLGDRTVVEDTEFRVIISACLLAKYGLGVLPLEETFREDLKWYS